MDSEDHLQFRRMLWIVAEHLCGKLVGSVGKLFGVLMMKMLLTGDFIDAAEAQWRGLVNRVVTLDHLDAEAQRLADSIYAKSSAAITLGKQMFYNQLVA